MALTHTAEDLVNKAAAILGRYVPGEALGAVEHDTIDKCIDDVLEEISKIVIIADRDEIPNMLFETIARLVAIYAAAEFSNAPPPLQAIADHEQRLRYLVARTPTYEVLRNYYY
jgi:hypothetical protein